MDVEQSDQDVVPLPLSDLFLLAIYTLFYPLFVGLIVISLGYLITNNILFYISLTVITFILFFIMLIFFYKSYTELRSYAIEVAYVHFQPSWRDLIIDIISQVYSIVFLGILLAVILGFIINDLPQWLLLGIALVISLGFQGIIVVLSVNSKRKLLATAQAPVNPEIVNRVRQNHPKSQLISEFRFAEIELASLFLSAGVMTLGWKNICLISQYFKWKLTDEELMAVISHEEGHLARHHIRTTYLILGTEGFLRTLRVYIVLTALILILNDLPIFTLNTFSFIFIILIILLFLTSSCLALIQRYRVYLQEIRADSYGGNLVGHEILANTLKKLPSVIPAPIGKQQLDFLTFRIALLREQASKSKSKTV